jgi:hypothetical protein
MIRQMLKLIWNRKPPESMSGGGIGSLTVFPSGMLYKSSIAAATTGCNSTAKKGTMRKNRQARKWNSLSTI